MNTATAQMEKEFPIHKAPYQSNNKKQTKGRIQARSNIQSIPFFNDKKEIVGYKHIQHKR